MTDRELLQLAAKAAGMAVNYPDGWNWVAHVGEHRLWGLWKGLIQPTPDNPNPRPIPVLWNPLTDDGDALRLAVTLHMEIDIGVHGVAVRHSTGIKILESFKTDPYAATRRAITRAAAEIGRNMP